ncbi:cell division protein FtsZ [archaeon BMS3Abin16]|nr:cell division protein FtsZ [archaeon BMS3Abin16]
MLYLVGVGGAGSKIVDALYQKNVVKKLIARIQSHEQNTVIGVAIDTSEKLKTLSNIPEKNVVLIGKSRVKGHGTGVDVALGRKIVTEELGLAMNKLSGVVKKKPWLVVFFSGLGGGTGTGGTPVIAKKVKEVYKTSTLGVFVLPSAGEGRVYTKNASENLESVLSSVDGSIILDNNVVTDKGEDILSAHKHVNQLIQGFFRMIDESFLERCLGERTSIAYYKPSSDHLSIKDAVETMLRDSFYLKFELESADKIVFIARGNLSYLYGHDFAQGWAQNRFGVELEYEFYDEPGSNSLELGLLVIGTKDLNGRFDEVKEVAGKKETSELDDLLKDIHSIF